MGYRIRIESGIDYGRVLVMLAGGNRHSGKVLGYMIDGVRGELWKGFGGGKKRMADRCGVDYKEIDRSLVWLQENGFLVRRDNEGGGGLFWELSDWMKKNIKKDLEE